MPFNKLGDSDKQRLGAAFYHLRQTSAHAAVIANVNWDQAALDFKPSGKPITGASFRTHAGRVMSKDFAVLKPADRHRLAVAFVNIQSASVLKSAMSSINWTNASRDYQSGGSRISAASFKTHVGRLMKKAHEEAAAEAEGEVGDGDDNDNDGVHDGAGDSNEVEAGESAQPTQAAERDSPFIKEENLDDGL